MTLRKSNYEKFPSDSETETEIREMQLEGISEATASAVAEIFNVGQDS